MYDYTNNGEFENEGYTFLYYLLDNNILEPKYSCKDVDRVPIREIISKQVLYYDLYKEYCEEELNCKPKII